MNAKKQKIAAWVLTVMCTLTMTLCLPMEDELLDNYGVARWVSTASPLHTQ